MQPHLFFSLDKLLMEFLLLSQGYFQTNVTPRQVPLIIVRQKNSMVHLGSHTNNNKLPTSFLQSSSRVINQILVLHRIRNNLHDKLGSYSGQSYEFSSIFISESVKKSKSFFIQDKLNNLRTSFIYLANFTALCIGVVIFQVMDDPPLQFLLIVLISQIIGTVMSLIFLCTIRQRRLSMDQNHEENANLSES